MDIEGQHAMINVHAKYYGQVLVIKPIVSFPDRENICKIRNTRNEEIDKRCFHNTKPRLN